MSNTASVDSVAATLTRRLHLPTPLVLAIAASVIGAAVRLYGLRTQSLWTDELFTAMYAVHYLPSESFLSLLLAEPHPPLYYIFMRLLLHVVPLGEVSLRLPGALCSAVAPPLFYWLTRREVGREAASGACIMLAFSSFLLFYAQDARFYAPMQLFAVASAGLWLRLIVRRDAPPTTTLYWLAAVNLAGSMLQFFGFVMAGFEWCLLFLLVPPLRKSRGLYVCGVVSLLPYVGWFIASYPYFSRLVGEGYWITHLSLFDLVSPVRSLFAQPSVLLIFLLPFAISGFSVPQRLMTTLRGERGRIVLASAAMALVVPLFAAAVTWSFSVVYFDKNFIVVFPFVYLGVAIVLVDAVGAAASRMLCGLFAIMLVSLVTFLVSGYPLRQATPFYTPYKEQIRESVDWIWRHAGPNDIVVLAADEPRDIPVYGFRLYTENWHDPALMHQVIFVPADATEQVRQLSAIVARARAEHRNVFLYDNHAKHFVPEAVDAVLRAVGCTVQRSFRAAWTLALYPDRACTVADLPSAGPVWPP